MIFEHSDYRNYLKAELIKRSQSNPKYSLRAYAQQLKMSPGQLSRVLQNKKRMSHEKALEVSSLLKLKGSRREYFCHLVHLDATKNLLAREYIEAKLKDLHPKKDFYSLDIDQFRVVSEWYHYAILELTELEDFKPNSRWVAKRLGISQSEVELALERLKRLNLLICEEPPSKRWKKVQKAYMASSSISNEAFKKFHKQTLEKAIQSLEVQTPDERHMSSVTVAIDPAKLSEAKQLIGQFRHNMAKLLGSDSKKEVYQLAIQLFRLTQKGAR